MGALSDLYRLFEEANRVEQVGKRNDKKKIELALKKIYFFLVWANEQKEDTFLVPFQLEVLAEWQQRNEDLKKTNN
jgi:hypothetical protein